MNDQQKNIVPHLKDEPVVWPLPSSDTPKELAETFTNAEKIVEVKNIDKLDFLDIITNDPNYKKTVESYTKREQKVVKYAIWEAVDNVVKHSLRDETVPEPTSTLSVIKEGHDTYDEVQIITENFFEKKEINETGGGAEKFKKRIEDINKKSIEELDAEHTKEMEKGSDSINAHGWSNLGFIDMARKIKKMYKKTVENIFKAVITPINEHISKLTMIIRIPILKTVLE